MEIPSKDICAHVHFGVPRSTGMTRITGKTTEYRKDQRI